MIDLQDLRERPAAYKKAVKDKGFADDIDVDEFLRIDEKRRSLVPEVEDMRAKKNEVSKAMPTLSDAEKKKAVSDMKRLNEELKEKEEGLEEAEKKWTDMHLWLPSLPLDSVPVGKDASGNVEAKKVGDPSTALRVKPSQVKDHATIGEALGIIDIPRGVKVAGARSYLLKGDGARLEQALIQYTINHLVKKGFTLISPPVLATWEALMGMGHFPGSEEQTYAVGVQSGREGPLEGDQLYLVGTSEASLLAAHQKEVFAAADLPMRFAGVSECFRREAGTYGKDTKGLYRVHQFKKVEQVIFCEADQEKALALFEEIRTNAEEVLQALRLPYRVMTMCTGDMGQGKVFMQDIETWMPSRSAYCETHSCSYLGDFQARRLNIKYDPPTGSGHDRGGERRFIHTLNNTCIASPRILIPLIETYQKENGNIEVPEVLQPYMGGQKVIGKG
jgi:seryl-tRNA synthetase